MIYPSKKIFFWRLTLLLCFFNAGMLLVSCDSQPAGLSVQIHSAKDQKILADFQSEIADSPDERAQGLMFRQHLDKNRAMLFVFPSMVQSSFWMKNTYIPLDIIFVDDHQRILNIVENAEPYSTTPRNPVSAYRYVLEIPGGRAQELGLKIQDELVFDLKKSSN